MVRVEKGDPSVSLGIYASVMFVLGMTERLANLLDPWPRKQPQPWLPPT
jgi:hypothetical protein